MLIVRFQRFNQALRYFAAVFIVLATVEACLAAVGGTLGSPPRLVSDSPSPLPPASFLSAAVDTSLRAEVVELYQSVYLASQGVDMGWQGDRDTCDAGTLDPRFHDATVLRVNYFRAMAGLGSDVVLDKTLNDRCQEAALMMSAEGRLSHAPGFDWACYSSDGADAAAHSNIYLGRAGPSAIDGYIDDPYAGNFFVGHRRWILYPPQQTMGSGSLPASNGFMAADALWVLGPFGERPPGTEWVAWPPPGYVPYEVTPRISRRWSFSYPRADFSHSTVSMTVDGVEVSVQLEPQENDRGYADNTLVWIPTGFPSIPPTTDLLCSVTVRDVVIGGQVREFAYDVILIDPEAILGVVTAVLPDAHENAAYAEQFKASGGQWPYSWSLPASSDPLPNGLELGPDGLLSGTPSESGVFQLKVEVVDGVGISSTTAIPLTVVAAGRPLEIISSFLPPAVTSPGSSYSVQLEASGGAGPYQWALAAESLPLPEGFVLIPDGQLVGSPTVKSVTDLIVQVTDREGVTVTRMLVLVVDPEPLFVATETIPPAKVSQEFLFDFSAVGGVPPYTWSLAPDSPGLSDGLALSAEGRLFGAPTSMGESSVTMQVTDALSEKAARTFNLVVNRAALGVVTETLPGGKVGLMYEHAFSGEGGVPPYSWTNASPVPAGLVVTSEGRLTGIPETEGSSNFTLWLEDAMGTTVECHFTLVVGTVSLSLVAIPQTVEDIAARGYRVDLLTDTGGTYTFECSQDLRTWSDLLTFTMKAGVSNLVDRTAVDWPHRQYRVRLQP